MKLRSDDEHRLLDEVLENLPSASIETLDHVDSGDRRFPIYGISMGRSDPKAPVFGIFAGVHGLEKIGSHVALSYLKTIAVLMKWDEMIHALLKRIRIISIPIINPAGMYLSRRSNGRHVDLMRNAPIEGDRIPPYRLYAGQTFTKSLPWYRGDPQNMEKESKAVIGFIQRQLKQSEVAISVDVHSGFGLRDRLWFPYAKSKEPFPYIAEAYALKHQLDQTYPNHIYQFEPQCLHYTTHGDLWDYIFIEQMKRNPGQVYIPLCLEMGSWNWVKKNPFQIFSITGPFNPIKQHRRQRTLRRHLILFDFMMRALISSSSWTKLTDEDRSHYAKNAKSLWSLG